MSGALIAAFFAGILVGRYFLRYPRQDRDALQARAVAAIESAAMDSGDSEMIKDRALRILREDT